jgi:hypothetical protein
MRPAGPPPHDAASAPAGILRDRLLRPDSPLLGPRLVTSVPFPIPPELARTPAVELMRREVIRAV